METKPVIVCVDDEQIILNSLNKQLSRKFGHQYEFEFCESGEEALEVIEELKRENHPVIMIISDQIMPGMSGDELLVKLHEMDKKMVKILLTGQAAIESAINAVNKADLYRYLTKPWDEDDMLITVERGLQQYFLQNEKSLLLSEVNHRVKNNLAIISGILQLQSGFVTEVKSREYLEQSVNRINSIAKVHEMIYQSEDLTSVEVKGYLDILIPAIQRSMSADCTEITINIDVEKAIMNINQIIPIGLMFNELITNSLKHAFKGRKKGTIFISMVEHGSQLSFEYRDDGRGYSQGRSFENSGNLGSTLINLQLSQLEADYEVDTENGFRLNFRFRKSVGGAHGNLL